MTVEGAVSQWRAGEVAAWLGASLEGDAAATFVAATTDSRDSREGTAFFALDGAKHRGSEFVPDAFGSGCSVVVVPNDWTGVLPPGTAAIHCADPEQALVRLAHRARSDWTAPVIAITGSVGKTTVKEMVAHALTGKGSVLRSPGNFNTAVGLARTLLGADEPDVAVLEVGASEPGEIARLASLVAPTAAAITQVSAAHLAGFGSVDDIRREKLDLLRAVPPGGCRVIDGDDPRLVEEARAIGSVIRVGLGPGNDWRAVDIRPDRHGTDFRLEGGESGRLSLPGSHQVKNALFAVALGEVHGVAAGSVLEALRQFVALTGRLVVHRRGGLTLADDSYNANPASMNVALEWLADTSDPGRRALALGDMLELGEESTAFHRALGRQVAELEPDLVVFCGRESRAASEECSARLGDRCRWTKSPEEAARILRDWVRPGDVLLVKGSRGMRMEVIVETILQAGDSDAG